MHKDFICEVIKCLTDVDKWHLNKCHMEYLDSIGQQDNPAYDALNTEQTIMFYKRFKIIEQLRREVAKCDQSDT